MDEVEGLDCVGFIEFLVREGFHEDVVSSFSNNRICGRTFVQLTEDDLKELLPVIGDRVRIRQLLNEIHQVSSHKVCYLCDIMINRFSQEVENNVQMMVQMVLVALKLTLPPVR